MNKINKSKPCSIFSKVLRLLGCWLGFSGLYAMFAVCPFCGQAGCPVGAGCAGFVGGIMAILIQDWINPFRFIYKKLFGSKN